MGKMALSEHFLLIGNRAYHGTYVFTVNDMWKISIKKKKNHNKNSVLITLSMETWRALKRIMKLYILPLKTVKGLVVSSKLFKQIINV